MSDKTKILLILLAVAGCVAAFYCLQNKSLKKQLDDKQHDIDVLEDSYMKLLKERECSGASSCEFIWNIKRCSIF